MSRLEELMQELCPDGVEFLEIGKCVKAVRNIKWKEHPGEKYRYIDLTSVDRTTHSIVDTQIIDATGAPSRAQQIVQVNDILLGATRPMLKRYCCVTAEYDGEICSTGFCVLRPNADRILSRWLYHNISSDSFFLHVEKFQKGASYPAISDADVKSFCIPAPPLPVQSEIVRILDNFTELTIELTTKLAEELTTRKKQYEFYRDSLLSLEKNRNVELYTIGELSTYRRGSFPQPYGNREWYDGEGAMPFVQVADIDDNMRLVPDTKRKISVAAQPKSVFAPAGSIIVSLQGSIGRIAITQYDAYIDRTVAVFQNISTKVIQKYFVYQLQRVFAMKEKTARGSTIKTITKEEFTDFLIPIPPLDEQQRIVEILDRFDALCNSLTFSLPAEIEARQKQYEYYRDKLLTFKELKENSD